MRRRPRNVVFLLTDSHDSLVKAGAYARAARALGFSVALQVGERTAAIVPASDFRALDAAWMCKTYGIPGPDPVAVAIASSKSLTYQLLQNRGFEMLRWIMPVTEADLHAPLPGPVIVKADAGSGSTSTQPWGYRVFDGMRDLRRYLHRGRLTTKFLDTQVRRRDQRHLVMEYVESPEVHSVATVAGDGRPVLFDTNVMRPMSDTNKVVGRILVGARHPDTATAVRMAGALAAAGLRRSIIYLQCVARRGRLYPIDLNLRPGAMWGQAAVALEVPAYEELLSVMLGLKARPQIRWPAPYIGIARVPMRLRPGNFPVVLRDRQAVALAPETRYDRARPWDLGHRWPMFAVPLERAGDFDRRVDAVAAAGLRPL